MLGNTFGSTQAINEKEADVCSVLSRVAHYEIRWFLICSSYKAQSSAKCEFWQNPKRLVYTEISTDAFI